MTTNITMEQNLLKRLYEMKYYEEKSWKDMYERSKTFQRSEKNNKNSNSIQNKNVLIPLKGQSKGEVLSYQNVLFYDKKTMEIEKEKRFLDILRYKKQLIEKRKKKCKNFKSSKSCFTDRCQTVLQERKKVNSIDKKSKILSALENEKLFVTGLQPGKTQHNFFTIGQKQKLRQFPKTANSFYVSPSTTKTQKRKSLFPVSKRKQSELLMVKKTSDFDVKPWAVSNFEEFQY